MRGKRTGNAWRLIAIFALSTVLILDGLSPAWSVAAGPDGFTDRSYQDAGYAGPSGLARFVPGNGAASLERLLFSVLGEGQISGVELEQNIEEGAQDILFALDETVDLAQVSVGDGDLTALEMLGWDENTDMIQRLVGSWGAGTDEDDSEHLWPELDGFESEWMERPNNLDIPLDLIADEWMDDDQYEGDWLEEQDYGEAGANEEIHDVAEDEWLAPDVELDTNDKIGVDTDSVRMPVWKAHSHTQERESRREITLNIGSINNFRFSDDGGISDSGSGDGAGDYNGENSGSDGDSQGDENLSSGNNGDHEDGEEPGENSGGGDGDNEDQGKDPDDKEGTYPDDEPSGDGEENDDDGKEIESDDEDEEQETPEQEEPKLYISAGGVWDGSIAASFAGGTGTASDPYLISNGAELAYLAQQVNSGTTYSGKYFLQTADIILNQNVMRSGAVQEQESVFEDGDINDENSDVKQDADEPGEDGGDVAKDEEDDSEAEVSEAEDMEREGNENHVQILQAISSVMVTPEGELDGDNGNETEAGVNVESVADENSDGAKDDSNSEKESNKGEEGTEEGQTHFLRIGSEPLEWTPIGNSSSRSFRGTYDGDGFAISGIYINTADDYQGLFGYVQSGLLKNIHLENTLIKGGSYTGGLAGSAGRIEDSRNSGRIEGGSHVGGLAGSASGNISGSRNEGSVSGAEQTGGIAGAFSGSMVSDSENRADVEGGRYTGGIAGYSSKGAYQYIEESVNYGVVRGAGDTGGILGGSGSWSVYITGCANKGPLVHAEGDYAGGIAGRTIGKIEDCETSAQVRGRNYVGGYAGHAGQTLGCISRADFDVSGLDYVGGVAGSVKTAAGCENYADISGGKNVGGIAGSAEDVSDGINEGRVQGQSYVGGLAGSASKTISGSWNTGNVTAESSYAGGLAGSAGRIEDSRNSGRIEGGSHVGGLAGSASGNISGSRNEGSVSGAEQTGGIAGAFSGSMVSDSENRADVEGGRYTGGIAGYSSKGAYQYIEESVNYGVVRGAGDTGGILGGSGSWSVYITGCANKGPLVHAEGDYAGGIAGRTIGKIEDCETSAQVRGGNYVGGYAGHVGTVVNCQNYSTVTGKDYIGGIAGTVTKALSNCTNSGAVTGTGTGTGGIVGTLNSSGAEISSSTNTAVVLGYSRVGGIAGETGSASNTISDCVNRGSSVYSSGSYAGGVAGYSAGEILDCSNSAAVHAEGSYAGGIAGYTTKGVENHANYADIHAAVGYAGGIAGYIGGTAENCENYGTITSGSYTGGIAGYAGTAAGCENYGIVQGETYTGGIAGQAGTLQDCRNEGIITGGEGTGGIAGLSGSGGASRCINLGEVSGTGKGTGGIIGTSSSTNSVLYACENQGDVAGVQGTGGILGSAGKTLRIEYSRNSGTVQGGDHTGGILGSAEGISGTIAVCINEGPLVSGGLGTGGIAGYTNFTISESINRGEATGTGSYIGSIAGRAGTLKDIVNNIDITGAGNYTGGLAGYAGRAENCYNTGTVSGAGTYNGGIAGQLVTAVDCTNKGTVRGRDYTGGIAGDGKDLSGCWNTGSVQGEDQGTGGIAGYSTGRIEDCHNTGSVSGGLSAGGIAGSQLGTVSRSRNMGTVSADSQAGGIAGFKSGGAVEKSLNTGYILFQETGGGGIAGAASSTQIRDAYSLGAVTGRREGAGGIAGQALSSVRVTNCYNTGNITGRGYTGGLAGFGGSGLSLTNSYYIHSTAGSSVGYEWGEDEPELTLKELSMRVSSADLKGMASDLGSAYGRDRQGINGGYPILVDVDYTSQPPQIGARPSPFSLGYGEFAVTAVEKMSPGSALEGAQVDLGSFGSEETDSSGTAVFSVGTGGGRHHLDVELEGYRRYFGDIQLPFGTNPHMIDNNSQFLAMLTPLYPDDSTVPYISTLMYYPEGERTVDVLTSSVNILTGKKAELVMNAEWNGKTPGSYVLFQLNGARLESSSGIFSEKLGDHFLPGEAIYAQVRAADSTMGGGEATGIQLVWGDTEKYVVSFFDGTAVKLPGFIPIPDIIPNITGIDVEVEFDDTKIRVYVGVKDTEVKRRLTELKKEAGGYGMENVKRILRSSTLRDKMNWGTFHIDMRLLGYAEWRMEQKNFITHPLAEPFVFKGDVGAIGEFKAKATHTGLFMAGPVPLYYRLGAGLNLDTELSAYVDLQRGIFETKDEITFTPEVGAEGGVGLPDLLSGGLDLAVKLPITFNQDREGRFSLDKAKLTGKANLKAAILGFVVEQDLLKMFFGETPEKIFYDRDKKGKEAAFSAASLIDISPIFDAAQFKPNPMEYAKSSSDWMAGAASENGTAEELFGRAARLSGEAAAEAVEPSGELLLQTNINQESRPQTASIPGMTVAAWTVNDTSRGVSANWPLLVYSVLDEAAGTWSTPAAVLDDGTGDFYPVLKEGGGSIWLSWQNAGKAFEEAPQSLEELAGELEAAAAVFDAGTRTFVRAGNITDNDVMDLMPVIAADGEGKAAVVWRTNSSGDLFGTSGTTSIWAMDLQTEEVQKLWETEKPVVSMDAGYRNGRLTAAVVADDDGDLTTADDRTLYLLSAGAAPVQAAGSSLIGGAPVFSRYKDQSVVFYSTGGMLKALFEDGSEEIIWAAEKADAEDTGEEYAASPGIGDFSAAYDAEGRVAVVWTGMQENMTMQIQVLLYDSSRDEWSRELRTESSSGSVAAPSAAFGSDGTLRVLYGRMTEDSITGMEQMDLCLAELASGYGIAIEEIWYDPYDEVPGEDLPVGLMVSNTGSLTIEEIVVDINGEETVLELHLLTGEDAEIQVMHPVGRTVEPASLPVKVSALDEAGSTAASDHAEFAAGYADAELSVQEVTNAWGQTAVITAGSRSWNTVSGTLEIRLDSADGPVIERIDLGTLAPDQSVHYSYGVPDDLRQGGRAEKLYFVLKTDQPELFTGNNIDYINLI